MVEMKKQNEKTVPTETFVINSAEFHRALKAVMVAASTDETRLHINAVWLGTSEKGTWQLGATNGHWLALWTSDVKIPKTSVSFSLKTAKRVLRDVGDVITPQVKKSFSIPLPSADITFNLTAGYYEHLMGRVNLQLLNEDFPPLMKVLNDAAGGAKLVYNMTTLALRYWEQSLKAFKAAVLPGDKSSAGISVHFGSRTGMDRRFMPAPVYMTSSTVPQLRCLVMPMVDDAKPLPAKVTKPKKDVMIKAPLSKKVAKAPVKKAVKKKVAKKAPARKTVKKKVAKKATRKKK